MNFEIPAMRSLLFVPGISASMMLKARDTSADALIFDLEDAVAPGQKLEARATVSQALREMDFGAKEVFVRINSLSSIWGLEDARAAATAGARGIVLPKAENADEVTTIAPILHGGQHGLHNKILCMIETPRGVLASRDLVESSELVVGLMFGAADLSRELGATLTAGEPELFYARSQVLLAARAGSVLAYDSPWFLVPDLAGLRSSSQVSRNLGYDGRAVIHPSQIDIVNEIFAPSAEQIAEAERVIAAMEAAHTEGRGVILLDGKMLDRVHLSAARKTLTQAGRLIAA